MLRSLLICATVLGIASIAGADTIALYNFDDGAGVDTVAAGVTAGDFTGTDFREFDVDVTIPDQVLLATNKNETQHMSFTVGAAEGLDLESLTFSIQEQRGRDYESEVFFKLVNADTTLIEDVPFDYSVGGDSGSAVTSAVIGGSGAAGTFDVDLSGVAASSSFEVRMHVQRYPSNYGFYDEWSVDDVTLTGQVIPEPATMSLLAIGGLGALLKRKRRS